MALFKEKLIELLIKQKILSKERLQEAIEIQRKKGLPLREVLLKEGFVEESKLISALSESLYLPTLNLSHYRIDRSLADIVPERLASQYTAVPVSRIGDTLTVAMFDPLNIFALDDLRIITGYRIDPVLALEKDILHAIQNVYSHKKEESVVTQEESVESPSTVLGEDTLELDNSKEQGDAVPVVKIVNLMLAEALKRRASDIHVEPQENNLRVRFRIDGELIDAFTIPKKSENAITARIKIISGLDITEARLPQDGRFKIKFLNKEVDFRVSLLPTSFGQTLVLRVLDRASLVVGLDALGFSPGSLALLKEAIARPYGMIVVTGPTGSGKSTTLYSVLSLLNTPERNIITIEDPVEYQLEGISQIPVKSDIGMNFAAGLRSILRQSPDVILIGEIRDSETADIAIKAALTGQFVMSTLHTNNAAQAITRLIDMGLEPFLVASSVIMSSAQRLMRVICSRCKKPDNPPDALLLNLGLNPDLQFFRGEGCPSCAHTGYYGRQAILEILMIDDIIREMVVKGATSEQIQEYAVRNSGMKTLRQEALLKAEKGITTVDEVVRVTAAQ